MPLNQLNPTKMKSLTPNDLGKKFLVEECRKITFREYLSRAKAQLKETLIASELSVFTTPVNFATSRTRFGGTRHWFACPACGRRVGVLFVHPINNAVGCRLCLELEYRKRRYKGMVESAF